MNTAGVHGGNGIGVIVVYAWLRLTRVNGRHYHIGCCLLQAVNARQHVLLLHCCCWRRLSYQ